MSGSTASDRGEMGAGLFGRQPRGRAARYVLSALALFGIIAAAIAANSAIRARAVRDPMDFLPRSTAIAVHLDVRPGSPAMERAQSAWSREDLGQLSRDAREIAQRLLARLDLDIDLAAEAAPWFGGELVAAVVPSDESPDTPMRESAVLVIRAADPEQARRSVERAAAQVAKKRGWARAEVRRRAGRITVWGRQPGAARLACAHRHGCVVIGSGDTVVNECLLAAGRPGERLADTPAFRESFASRGAESLVTAYASVSKIASLAPRELSGFGRRPFGRDRGRSSRGAAPPSTGGIALALTLTPEPEGLRVWAGYREPHMQRPKLPVEEMRRLAAVLPSTASAYLLVADPQELLGLAYGFVLLRGLAGAGALGPLAGLAAVPGVVPLGVRVPGPAMIGILPGEGDSPPAVIAAFPSSGVEKKPSWVTQPLFGKLLASSVIGGVLVVSSSEQALDQCRKASSDPRARLRPAPAADAEFEAWLLPPKLTPQLAWLEELRVAVRRSPKGMEAEAVLRAQPGKLLRGIAEGMRDARPSSPRGSLAQVAR